MSAPKQDMSVAAALLRLRNLDDSAPLRAWLKQWSEAEVIKCVNQGGEMLYRAQGRAQVLLELLQAVEESPGVAAKLSGR